MTAFVFKIQANMDPNHRDRIAFARLCSGQLTRGMKVTPGPHRQDHQPEHAAVLLRAGARARRTGVCRRCVRHSQPRHPAYRRYADRRRGAELRRRAELCAGNPAPGSACGRHEGEEAAPGARRNSPRRGPCRCFARSTARRRSLASSVNCSSTCWQIGLRANTASTWDLKPVNSHSHAGFHARTRTGWPNSSPRNAAPLRRTSTAIRSVCSDPRSTSITRLQQWPGVTFTDVKDLHAKQ